MVKLCAKTTLFSFFFKNSGQSPQRKCITIPVLTAAHRGWNDLVVGSKLAVLPKLNDNCIERYLYCDLARTAVQRFSSQNCSGLSSARTVDLLDMTRQTPLLIIPMSGSGSAKDGCVTLHNIYVRQFFFNRTLQWFKHHKRSKELFSIGRNRTKRANFWESPLFQATYNIKTQKQTINSTYLASLRCGRLAEPRTL